MSDKAMVTKSSNNLAGLHKKMTEVEFENGYWYATDLKEFADKIGIPAAGRLRKDELENAIRHFLRTGEVKNLVKRSTATSSAPRDVDIGLRLDLPIVHYTSNDETKEFIEREAAKLEPNFRRKPGTRYLLNRWREEQISSGKMITYGDLVRQAIHLNKTKTGPLRIEHGRYINFISDFMKANNGADRSKAVRAWEELKKMDVPKTYEAWVKAKK